MAPHPILNGSNSHDVVKYSWVTRQRVLFEFLAGLQQVTARHVFGEIQHMTHNLGLQGRWIHIMHSRGRYRASIARWRPTPKLEPLYCAKALTVAWRSVLLPARCFTRTISLGWHHLTSVSREDARAVGEAEFGTLMLGPAKREMKRRGSMSASDSLSDIGAWPAYVAE
jgi:hypothetical protein